MHDYHFFCVHNISNGIKCSYRDLDLVYMSINLEQGLIQGSRGGAAVKALASHQCGPGSNPGVDTMCGLSLLLVLSPCSERFFSGCSGIPHSTKTSISKFQFNQESGRRRTSMWMCYLQIVIYLFILFIIYLIVVLLLLLFFCFYFNFNEVLPNMARERKRKTVR